MPTFGRYTLVRRVGTGGMAEIWKAKAQGPAGFEKILAIKKVLPHLAEDPEFVDMFVEEAKLVAGLVHPNIVQVFDFGQVGETGSTTPTYFIAMEYVPGANLALILRRIAARGARLPLEVALYVASEACKGLGYAHAKTDHAGRPLDIVHRDVSPQNILVSFGGEVKVTDFGIAKVQSALSRTGEGHVRGKLAYLSPEQARLKPVDCRSDLFALGVVVYELVTGKRLFAGSSGSEIFSRVTEFQRLDEADVESLHYEVRNILETALQPDPDERYGQAAEMEQALNAALGPEAIVQARQALASIVQKLFEDERLLEMQPDPPSVGERAEERAGGSGAIPISASGAGALETIISGNPDPDPVPGVQGPAATGGTPSGLTLVPSGVRAVSAPPEVLPAPPAVRSVATPGGNTREPRVRSAPLAIGGVLAVIVAAGAAALLVPRLFTGAPVVVAPTPIPFETAAPDPTPVVEASTIPSDATPVPAETVVRTPRPTPVSTRVAVQPTRPPTPRPTQTPAAVVRTAFLTVNARPWVQVFVDGRLVSAETPLRRHELPAGRHTIRFVNPGLGYSHERTLNIPENAELDVFVDVPKKAIRFQ